MGRMVVSVSFPSDVANWVETHWEKGTVSAHLVDLVRITMKGSGSALPRQDPNDFSRVPYNERISMAVATLTPHKEKFLAGQMSQASFLEAVKSVSIKLKVEDRTILAALPGGSKR